ncbi:hypothetical protein TcCL_Unassigned01601 [Trypanosoma cruzi]|nr:hypothetical protein TcCL_Unassigned01601 [Trypanosoma cruzi]
MRRRKGEAVRVRRSSHPLWKCCAACGGIALKCRTITHEDVARSGISFFVCLLLWVWVCLRRTCRHDGRSVWLPLSSLGEYAATLSIVCCFGDNVLVTVRLPDGGRGVEGIAWVQRSRVALGVSPRRALPAQPSTAPVGHSISICSIVVDASSTQRGSGCRHRHECDRKGTLQLLRSEGATRVAQWRAHNPLADSAQETGHWPRSVCVMGDTAAASLLLSGGRTPDFTLFPTQADGCAMTPQQNEAFVFTMEGHYLWCYALGI